MSEYDHLQQMLDSLNSRLAPAPGVSSPPMYPGVLPHTAAPVTPPQPAITVDSIRAMINEAVAAELKDVKKPPEAVAQPKPAQPNLQESMMREFLNKLRLAIGAGLTGDQQVWLSSNILALNGFLLSPEGKSLVQDLLMRFKTYVDQNPAS